MSASPTTAPARTAPPSGPALVSPDQAASRVGPILFTLLLAALSFALLQTMVAPALPAIQRDFATSPSTAAWVLTGFLLSASVATPIVGKLGDLYGKGLMLTGVLVVFAVGSLIATFAGSIELLIAARILQGVAGGVFPLAFGIIRDTFPPARVPLGIGLLSAMFGIGGGVGLVLAGVIVDNADVSWLFLVGLVAAPAALTAWRVIPPSPARKHTRIDWPGALVLSAGLVGVLLGVSRANEWGWGSAPVLALVLGGLVLLVAWVALELRVHEPLVEMRLLRQPRVLAPNLAGLVIGFAMFSHFLLVPQLVQAPETTGYGFGASTTQAGLYMLPSALAMLVAGPLAGILGARLGSRTTLVAGAALVCASFGWLALSHSAWEILVTSFLVGAGIAFALSSMANLIVEAVPQGDVGVATGVNTIARTVGGAVGAQLAVAIIVAHPLAGTRLPAESGYTLAFAVAAAAGLVAILLALSVPHGAGRAVPAPAPA